MKEILTEQQFKTEVLDSEGVTIVDVYSPMCQPCRMMMPTLTEISSKYSIFKVNGMEEGGNAVARQYNISRVPVLLFIKDGKEAKRITGLAKKQEIEKVMGELMAKTASNDISGEK